MEKEDKERIKAFATECWEEGTWSGYDSIELFYVGAEYEHRHLSQRLKEMTEKIEHLDCICSELGAELAEKEEQLRLCNIDQLNAEAQLKEKEEQIKALRAEIANLRGVLPNIIDDNLLTEQK